MKIINLTKALTIIILFLSHNILFSQVVVERSKDMVTIYGIPYYVHQVKKGETAYSISRAYGLSAEELIKENPPAVYGIREGQAIKIPVHLVREIKPSEPLPEVRPRDEAKFIYHNLMPGETVYSLSKSYGVSENEIVVSNPGIDINNMSVGAEIAVPRRVFMSDRQRFEDQDNKYIYHKVRTGESLSSIAETYGIALRLLRRENRGLRFPKVGDYIRIPGDFSEEQASDLIIFDTTGVVIEEPVEKFDRPPGYTRIEELDGSVNVAVLLPFYLKENSVRTEIDSSKYVGDRKIYNIINKPEDWIYQMSIDFIEMYEGILLAVDTLCSLGLDINLNVFDINIDTVEVIKLINSGRLSEMDLIIGPVYSHNLIYVADYARDQDIPIVSPVPLINKNVLNNNPNLFMANSSLEVAQKALSKKICDYYGENIVFIHTDTAGNDIDVQRFKNLIFTELSYMLPYDEVRFKEFYFYSRSVFDNDSINRLSHALSDQSKNIIIIASEDPSVISETIGTLHGLSRKFDIEVLGYPLLIDIDNLDPKYFFDLGITVYSPYWIDHNRNDVKQFNADFRQKFLTEPSQISYAWQGYDIAYYFLSGMALFGKDFISHPEIHYPDLLHTEYDFERKSILDGFENQKLFLIRYTKDYKVILVDDDVITTPD